MDPIPSLTNTDTLATPASNILAGIQLKVVDAHPVDLSQDLASVPMFTDGIGAPVWGKLPCPAGN